MLFIFSGNLRRFIGFQKKVSIESATVNEGIQRLVKHYPDIKPVLLDSENRVRTVHRLFLNDEMLPHDDLTHPTQADDEVRVITAIAGG